LKISTSRLALIIVGLCILISGCSSTALKFGDPVKVDAAPLAETSSRDVDAIIREYASIYDVPETLIRRVVQKESKFNPSAHNGPYWGLMQIRHDTARSMGYDGSAKGLLDARANLKYGVKYLRGAYIVADKNHDRAMRLYASGYYYDAKRKGLLREAGFKK
jgi:soluble lytic murein transglycosylase-like protein